MSPGYQKCHPLTRDSGEWRQLLYIKKTAEGFRNYVDAVYAGNQLAVRLSGDVCFWPLADPHFVDVRGD